MELPAYGIFEGGGARGLGHVAGLKAAETNGLRFIGVAGASAGALIASLVAVGYTADELFDPNAPAANLLSRHQVSPLDLLGQGQWKLFAKAQRQARRAAAWGVAGGIIPAGLFARQAVQVAQTVRRDGGFFTTDLVRDTLNTFLYRKLREHHANAGRATVVPERVRFRDMDPTVAPECCTLKVIATDVTHQRMQVFGNTGDTADVEVAEAVAASISIPLVFKPARVRSYAHGGGTLYADGGMVSNLPIWVFAEEKLNYEREKLPNSRVPIIAFTLSDPPAAAPQAAAGGMFSPRPGPLDYWTGLPRAEQPRPAPNSVDYWAAVGRSAIFGGQAVAQLFAADLRVVNMPVGLTVTGFDFSLSEALDSYDAARAAAAGVLAREMRLRPQQATVALQAFLAVAAAESGIPPAGLRASLIGPVGRSSFKVTTGVNMADDADDRLFFGRQSPGAPVAYLERRPAFIDFAAARAAPAVAGMTKYEWALVPPRICAAICLPVFADVASWAEPDPGKRPPPLGVVSIDSAQALNHLFNDAVALQRVAAASLQLSALFEQ